jgi:hypothetical protein
MACECNGGAGDKCLASVWKTLVTRGASTTVLNAAGKAPLLREDKLKNCVIC